MVARDAGDILSEAVRTGLLPDDTRHITLYTSLSQYVQRAIARRRRPLIVQDETTHEFRINHPVDDWPHIKPPMRAAPVSADAINAISHRLHSTSTSTLPESFEKAVCDAFGALAFVATHHGGVGAPDGILKAPLGPLAFRAIVECKTAQPGGTVNAPRLEEPAKFRDAHKAEFAVLVGPALSVDSAFESEMQAHAVSVWTVDDVVNALQLGVGPLECRDLFAAGIVEDRLTDLAWDREHGGEKRLAVIASVLHTTAWNAQKILVGRVDATDAPALSVQAALQP